MESSRTGVNFQPYQSPLSSSCSSYTSHCISEHATFLYASGPLHLLFLRTGFSSFSSSVLAPSPSSGVNSSERPALIMPPG